MKFKYILLPFISLCTVGCNDSFLDRKPQDQLFDESFWKVEQDAVQYSTSIYRYLVQPGNHMIMLDAYTDNAIPVHIHAEQGDISSCTATSSNPHFLQVWQDAYNGIRRCNIFMENIEKVEMDSKKKEVLTGEVEFLRAYFYSTLLKFFGGVPILTKTLGLNDPIPARDSEDKVYEFIIEECDNAAKLLPLKRTESSEIGRANKGAALALKAHMAYLHKDYKVAAAAAEEVMNLKVYDLFDNYGGLFEKANENNCEVIFDHQYMDNAVDYFYTGSWIDQYFSPIMMGGWEALSPSQDLIDEYECIDGKSISVSDIYDPKNPYENRDPRLAYSVLWHGCEFAGKTYSSENMGDGNSTRTGYTIRKYIDPENVGNEYPGAINFIMLRYAEMLLIYAESINEDKGPVQKVYDAVNKVRKRAGMPDLPKGMAKDEMRKAIRHERRVEFAFEGMHLFETRSWKTTEECVNKPVHGRTFDGKDVLVEQRKFNPEKDYLWAIPLTEIDLSKGSLVQNPGY